MLEFVSDQVSPYMYLSELRKNFLNKSKLMSLLLNKNFVNWLKDETKFLDEYYENIPNKIRAYILYNNITKETLPKCKNSNCNNLATLNITDTYKGFREYCGPECSRSAPKTNQNTYNKLNDKNWLHQQRNILKKSAYVIAKELNVSDFTVSKYIKKFDLNLCDLRKPNKNATDVLTNKNKLQELYEQGKTCEEISILIGTTKSTVARWLNNYNIELRPPNSYERKTNYTSSEEQEVVDFIQKELNINCSISNRSILNGKELDIYIPQHNIAIEYDGLYSHIYRPWETSDSKIKNRKYHLNKTLECEKNNIQLLHIFSDEWQFKKNIVKSIIRSKLNKSNRIYARNTIIKEVSTYDKNIFLDENHIQGRDKSKIKLGLYFDDLLIAIMTFGGSRFNKNYDWELIRFATKIDHTVVGGFSKLLKYFRKKYDENIISYADRRYSNGNVYLKNGFNLLKTNLPSYYYVDKKTYRTKYNRMKFQKKLINCENNQTEYERARELGFEKIYDCGTLSFGLYSL